MDRLPKPGERVHIRWPNGPYDFDMIFQREDTQMPAPAAGWVWLRGEVFYSAGVEYRDVRTLYVKPTPEGYEMLPMGGGPMDG